jgi:hypothetical protein
MRQYCLFSLFIILSLLHFNCSNQNVAGGGIDTESSGGRLTGAVINNNNASFANNTHLQLVSQNHSPYSNDSIYYAATNDSGRFSFSKIDTGFYTLEAVHPIFGTRFLKRGIHITENNETSIVPETLKTPGSIKIYLGSQSFPNNSLLYIPGTSFSLKLTGGDFLIIDSIAPGIIPPILYSETNGENSKSITDTLLLHSAETITVAAYKNWLHTMNITIDTYNSGSEITSELHNVPLLVHLDNTNFDFKTVSPDQKDLRFISSTGKTLPYQIDHWDSIGTKTALWVLLDTIKPKDASQFITMRWGNTSANTVSNGATVFDTINGFRAVLHIDEESSGVRNHGLYKDATILANHGDDYINDRDSTGIIGRGKHFDYKQEDFVLIDSLKDCSFGTGPFTISLWFRKDSSQTSNLFAWYFGKDSIPFGASIDHSDSIRVCYASDTITSAYAPGIDTWIHLVLTRTSAQLLTIYINGNPNKPVPFTKTVGEDSGMFFIGSDIKVYPGPDLLKRSFKGNIDEFRIEASPMSADEVKFTYLNQSTSLMLKYNRLQ